MRRLVAVVIIAVAFAGACGSSSSDKLATEAVTQEVADLTYSIPAGTGTRLDAGEEVELVPAVIEAHVGDVIQIVNSDDRSYLIGPFFVGPNETTTQRFSSAGEFEGACYVHPSGTVTVIVTE